MLLVGFFCHVWDGNSQGRRLVNKVGVRKNRGAIKSEIRSRNMCV